MHNILRSGVRVLRFLDNQVGVIQVTVRRELNFRPIQTENKIVTGHKMTRVIDKLRTKHLVKQVEEEKHIGVTHPRFNTKNKKLLIACSSPVFNHYTSQTYKNFSDKQNLASYGWVNRRSAGKYFTINPVTSHPSMINPAMVMNTEKPVFEFDDFRVLNQVLRDLLSMNQSITRPTHIQLMSVNQVLRRDNHVLMVAETGGGKTLSYVLPMIETIVRTRMFLDQIRVKRTNGQPIGIILVPTRELAYQVHDMIGQLTATDKIDKTNMDQSQLGYLDNVENIKVQVDLNDAQLQAKAKIDAEMKLVDENAKTESNNSQPVDLLITLPGQLLKRQQDNIFDSTFLRTLVLDEADTLLDDSFSPITLEALTKLKLNLSLPKLVRKTPIASSEEYDVDPNIELSMELDQKLKDPSTQLQFVSATIPRSMKSILENLIDCDTQLTRIATNQVNKLLLHVPHKFMRTNGEKRLPLLLEIVRKELAKSRTCMIFSHRTKTVEFVYKFLLENQIDSCDMLINRLDNEERQRVVARFLNGQTRILCCTDIASRGWNTLMVNHVINFEMPPFIADYLHRSGRVGRLNSQKRGGGDGLVTNFVTKAYEVDLVMNIERSLRLGIELPNVNANIKRLYTHTISTSRSNKPESDEIN